MGDQSSYLSNYFSINIKLLKISFFWYPEKVVTKYDFFKKMRTMILIFICFLYFLSEIYNLTFFLDNLKVIISNMLVILSQIIAFYKIKNHITNRGIILEIMRQMEDKNLEYKMSDNFKPQEIIRRAKIQNYAFTIIFYSLLLTILCNNYVPELLNLYFNEQKFYAYNQIGELTYCQKLPFDSWIPFDRSTRKACFFAHLYQFIILIVLGNYIASCDTVFISLVNFLTAHVFVICEAFKTVPLRCKIREGSVPNFNLEEEMYDEFKKTVYYLKIVIGYVLYFLILHYCGL